jgi:hypothetical protein
VVYINLILTILKELKCFRSFKNFDQEKFTEDLNKIDFDKLTDHDDVNKMYSDVKQTVDKHVPIKQRKPCQNPAPFINKELAAEIWHIEGPKMYRFRGNSVI